MRNEHFKTRPEQTYYLRTRMDGMALVAALLTCLAQAAISPKETPRQLLRSPIQDRQAPPELAEPNSGQPWTIQETAPVFGLRHYATEASGALWLGSTNGAVRFDPSSEHRWGRWRYFQGPRWLPDDSIENIVLVEDPNKTDIWIRTASGVSHLVFKACSLTDKAAWFEERIEKRHVRHGLIADSNLRIPGELKSNQLFSNDNDGLWSAIYLASQAYRFAVTGSPEARTRAKRTLDALMRLESITGIPGFYARSFITAEEPQPGDGEWHDTADGLWKWKGDTSSDESVGHYYAYALYSDLVADPSEKEAIRQVVRRMTDYLIANDYDLLDVDGKPTRWGQWSERYFATVEGTYEAPLRCLELLSFLRTTHHLTGDPKYEAAYQDRVERGYADRVRDYRRWPGGGEINFSDDELAYLSYAPLLAYEQDPSLRAIYLDSLRFTWSQIRTDRNPLWNYLTVAADAVPMTGTLAWESRITLERIPWDLIEWSVRNSHRQDLEWQTDQDRFGRRYLQTPLPPDERPIAKWNTNPYRADGGQGGRVEDDGAFFLLPYWLGRYHGWLE